LPKKIFRLIFLVSFLAISEISLAQSWQLGVKGGLSLPKLSSSGSSEVSKGYLSISGPDLAIVADRKIRKNLSVELGLEWSTQGGQKSGLQTIPVSSDLAQYFPPGLNSDFLYADFESTVRLQYLMLPVLLKYTMPLGNSDRWKLYADGGLFGAWLVTATGSAMGSSKVYFDKAQSQQVGNVIVKLDSTGSIKKQLHEGNIGVEANLGLLFQMSNTAIFIEGGGNYGFIGLQKNSQNGVNHAGALIFRIGLMMNIKSKA
jgi:Outer membrane protein beta-barrel domain